MTALYYSDLKGNLICSHNQLDINDLRIKIVAYCNDNSTLNSIVWFLVSAGHKIVVFLDDANEISNMKFVVTYIKRGY